LKRVRWAQAAAEDLESIYEYLREYHPTRVALTIRKLHASACSLKRFPGRGRVGQSTGTRELVLTPLPYIIVYAAAGDLVHILRIMHASQEWPTE